ncbi:hypothetical protein U9R90_06235 [Streptomyces sp. E11-3]|uniref:hypothetical protein n=1 Tax=Streptomyces sp. E11-3 TaxID=3110112 RepID=UPI00397F8F69
MWCKERGLRRIVRRCDTHDTASQAKARALETELGMEPSEPTGSLTNPNLIDCGKPWCSNRRT